MTPKISIERIEEIFMDAMSSESFERLGNRRGVWDVSRDCDKPVPVVLHSRATEQFPLGAGFVRKPGIELTMFVPCRKCRVCLEKKSKLWTYRAINECKAAPRTWFGTFTCRPSVHYILDERASTMTNRDFWTSPMAKKFEMRVRVLGSEVTLYFKRLRKAGYQFRYLLVSEMHDSADTSPDMRYRPHVHMLIHEVTGADSLTKRVIQAGWPHGFTHMKLVADRGIEPAWYISKYITKANDARIRASLEYGNQECEDLFEQRYQRTS